MSGSKTAVSAGGANTSKVSILTVSATSSSGCRSVMRWIRRAARRDELHDASMADDNIRIIAKNFGLIFHCDDI
ncbi:MAG: hypothetical protein MJZ90_06650 [Bacteroidales bacterium]|nr:hypothetical protein [Bacteroidales bacterium]